jgi:hypothetical protein
MHCGFDTASPSRTKPVSGRDAVRQKKRFGEPVGTVSIRRPPVKLLNPAFFSAMRRARSADRGWNCGHGVVQFIDELPIQSAMEVLSKSEIQRATAILQVAR